MQDFIRRCWNDPVFWYPVLPVTLGLLAITIVAVSMANAQDNHSAGHAHYKSWTNKNAQSCCNDADCGTLKPQDERRDGGKLQVRIEGQWCEVESWMYLRTGNAPDWSSSHVCVWPDYDGRATSPCGRLKCYQPGPLF